MLKEEILFLVGRGTHEKSTEGDEIYIEDVFIRKKCFSWDAECCQVAVGLPLEKYTENGSNAIVYLEQIQI